MKTANERPELIVTLRAGDNRQIPVFFVHPSGGSCMSYAALCREMPPGIPCFGIESLGLDGGELPRSVDEMAEAYAAAIQAAHPEGPYHLMGWSAGGGLAYATAVRLRRQGREVGLLAMLDTPPPPVLPQAPDASVLRVLFAENFSLTVGLQPTDLSAADLAALDDVAQIEKVISALVESGMVPDESTQMLRWRMAVFVAITSAVTVWRPEHYDGRIDLFHTAASPESAAAKWSGLTSGQLVVHEAPGDHYSMTSPPHVAELGRVLGKLLEGSLRATG